MIRRFFLFALIYVISDVTAQWSIDDDGCRTPDRGVGNCIVVRNCQPVIDVLNQASRPISAEIIQLLQSYQCGYEGNQPKVCCPSKPINVGDNKPSKEDEGYVDVSNHRNIDLLPKDCGHIDTGDRIINGNKTRLFEFPWMTLLSYNTNRGPKFQCGGTIINDRYILTAAHCITNLRSPLLGVRVGDHDWTQEVDCERLANGKEICAKPYQDLKIEQIITHPGYNLTLLINDIGLLRVSQITMNDESVRAVCLPLDADNMNYDFENGRNVIVTGWGATSNNDGRFSPDLLKVYIPVVPFESCRKRYENVVTITPKQMCAGGKNNKDSCGGDSGGPLHIVGVLHNDARYIQHGIVSFGPKVCAIENNPGVYTKVAHYVKWILDNIRT